MFSEGHLIIRHRRIKYSEEWTATEKGLLFLFPTNGAGEFFSAPGTGRLAAGDVVRSSGKGAVTVRAASGEFVFSEFGLRLEQLFPLFSGNEISLVERVSQNLQSAKVYSASTRMAQECHRLIQEVPASFGLEHRSHLLRVAACILAEEFKMARLAAATGFIRIEEHMTRALGELSTTDLSEIPVRKLADRFGCSRRHLNRLFHQYFGCSAAALRMELRLLTAVALLRDADAKVINVAEQCGFHNLGLFNTCFKRRFGVSPAQWRKAKRVEVEAVPLLNADRECQLRANGLCPWTERYPRSTCNPAARLLVRVSSPEGPGVVPANRCFENRTSQPGFAVNREESPSSETG